MTEIKIGGRTIPLFYSALEMVAIQEEIGCTAYQLVDEVFGIQQDDDTPEKIHLDVAKDPKKTRKLGKLLAILGNAGLEENGEEPDLTDKWILRKLRAPQIVPAALIALSVVVEGNQFETPDQAEDKGPVDVTLEEQQAKKQPGN